MKDQINALSDEDFRKFVSQGLINRPLAEDNLDPDAQFCYQNLDNKHRKNFEEVILSSKKWDEMMYVVFLKKEEKEVEPFITDAMMRRFLSNPEGIYQSVNSQPFNVEEKSGFYYALISKSIKNLVDSEDYIALMKLFESESGFNKLDLLMKFKVDKEKLKLMLTPAVVDKINANLTYKL